MRRSLTIAGMAGLALALAAILAVRAGLDRPVLAAMRAIDPRMAAAMVIAAVLVQVALFLRVREDEELPAAGRMARAPRTRMGRAMTLGNGTVPVIARRTGLPQDVVALALRRTRESATSMVARQNQPSAASLATDPVTLNGLIRRLTRS